MKKVLTIKDIATAQNAVEELMYSLEKDLAVNENSFQRNYYNELENVSLKLDRIINYLNDEDENNELIEIEEDENCCLYLQEK